MTHKLFSGSGKLGRRVFSGFLAVVVLLGILPVYTAPTASAESFYQPYLDKMVDWGVMRGDIDGNLSADRTITRAEFVTMVNRAYGYTDVGPIPFTDVKSSDWFYDDICIAYNVGYFAGTSAKEASPYSPLTREQAAVILARNMLMEESSGEALGFTDSRDLQEWSRGLIEALSDAGVVSGYPDGSFKPQNTITRGEVAVMLSAAVGTPIQEEGDYSLGSVYGNLTITSPDVTLKDTTIAGDLYLSGGVGLGAVQLENVTVLGKIVVAGGGESESASNSILLRNVEADKLVVDSILDNFVTVRTEGTTLIPETAIRISSYLEDMTSSDYGLQLVNVDATSGSTVYLAGNVKDVTNLTPYSNLVLAQGLADKVTVDEVATGSTLTISDNVVANGVYLDTATLIQGDGDIASLNVNAAGSTVRMLPEQIDVRPGITADISGVTMDTIAAEESSSYPKLLTGYPTARNIAPNSATAVFSANKQGTIYWALTALADGSVSEADLITPPAYSGRILASGSIAVTASNTEVTASLTKLTSDGSYYISAVLVDGRGQHSVVKVATFSTPDDTVPDFATGYPVMTKIESERAQVTVMPTKSCQLYYAVLPKGSTTPTTSDFKTNAVSGNLGYGIVDVVKNSTSPFWVNSIPLEEQVSYDLYLWLNDYDSAKSSAIKKVTFTTVDGTPPIIRQIEQTDAKAASIDMNFALNEPGTLYWAVVKEGDAFLRPLAGQTTAPLFTDTAAKVQVENGMGSVKKGSATAAKGDTDVKFSISGLTAQTNYDLYYIAKDKAGNYSSEVKKITINTLDTEAPTVTLEFTSYNGTNSTSPLPDTDIRMVFSESIQGAEKNSKNEWSYTKWIELYQSVATSTGDQQAEYREELAAELRKHITFYQIENGTRKEVEQRTGGQADTEDWVIDYRYATVTMEDGKTIVTFPTTEKEETSALKLGSGITYLFHLKNVADTASKPNVLSNLDLPQFTTLSAQVNLSVSNESSIAFNNEYVKDIRLDLSFQLQPVSTGTADDEEKWDMILWCDQPVTFQMYYRILDKKTVKQDWTPVGQEPSAFPKNVYYTSNYLSTQAKTVSIAMPDSGGYSAISTRFKWFSSGNSVTFENLNSLNDEYTYEYGIHFTEVGTGESRDVYETWSDLVRMKVNIVSGGQANLSNLSYNVVPNWQSYLDDELVNSIGVAYSSKTTTDTLSISKQFIDQQSPTFIRETPKITNIHSTTAELDVMVNRAATVYYVVAPKGDLDPVTSSGTAINSSNDYSLGPDSETYVPKDGTETPPSLSSPDFLTIVSQKFPYNQNIKCGTLQFSSSMLRIPLSGLLPETEYYVYFVLKGVGDTYSEVLAYQFATEPVETPIVTVKNKSPKGTIETDQESFVYYALVEQNNLPDVFSAEMKNYLDDETEASIQANKSLRETFYGATSSNGTTISKPITVIQAMIQEDGEGKSYFDLYAPDTLKSAVQLYISGSGGNTSNNTQITTSGQYADLKADTLQTIDFTKSITSGPEYYLMVAARHVNGLDYGFKAVGSINLPDDEPPEYSGTTPYLMASIDSYTLDGHTGTNLSDLANLDPQKLQYCKFSGDVTISFNKNLYQISEQNGVKVRKAVVLNESYTPDYTDSSGNPLDKVYLLDICEGAIAGKAEPLKSSSSVSSSFTIKFTDISAGQELILFSDGEIGNATSVSTTKKLHLKFNPLLTAESYGMSLLIKPTTSSTTTTDSSGSSTTSTTTTETVLYMPGFSVEWKDN